MASDRDIELTGPSSSSSVRDAHIDAAIEALRNVRGATAWEDHAYARVITILEDAKR